MLKGDQTFRRYVPDVVLHLAAQVAVTTSVIDPRQDFEINAMGTFNVLEAVRKNCPDAIVLNASTNKVYGKLADLVVEDEAKRWKMPGLPNGVAETQPLDFHSPYGCSKGTGDQYVADYARIFGLHREFSPVVHLWLPSVWG